MDAPAPAPLVSVLIPVHDGEPFLDEAIQSVRDQTHENWRLVIIDNASTDATPRIAAAHAAQDERITVVHHDDLVPVYGNFNRAAGHVAPGSRYFKFLCADDVLYPDCLRAMVGVGERHPSVGLVSAHRHDGDTVNIAGVPVGVEALDGAEVAARLLMGGTYGFLFGSPSSILLRVGVVPRTPLFDEGLLHADTDLGYAFLAASDFGFVHQILTYTRRHAGAITSYASRMSTYRPEYIRILRRWGPRFLEQDAFERRLAVLTAVYARDVLGRPRRLADPAFRDYHRSALPGALGGQGAVVARGVGRQVAHVLERYRGRAGRDGAPR